MGSLLGAYGELFASLLRAYRVLMGSPIRTFLEFIESIFSLSAEFMYFFGFLIHSVNVRASLA